MRPRVMSLGLAACALSCAGVRGSSQPPPDYRKYLVVETAAGSTPSIVRPTSDGPLSGLGPRRMLTTDEARRYMVALINVDRAAYGLPAVELDEGAPSRAGQAHADDMATHGYLGHWGTDGSIPEQRFTDEGGADMVLENASCFIDEHERTLDRAPLIDPKNVERAEQMFFDEPPGHDGHRLNILKPWHTHVGIGVAQPVASATEIPVPCFTQEFIDAYGDYAALPHHARVGDALHVEGVLHAPAMIAGVGLARVAAPSLISPADANQRRSYQVPEPYQLYWPSGFKTPIPLRVDGAHFAIDVPLSDGGRPGTYELSVWAKMAGSRDFVMVGLRTIRVD